jgi:hypothetical protein
LNVESAKHKTTWEKAEEQVAKFMKQMEEEQE